MQDQPPDTKKLDIHALTRHFDGQETFQHREVNLPYWSLLRGVVGFEVLTAVLPKATGVFEDTTDQTNRLPLRALLFVQEMFYLPSIARKGL